MFGWIITAFGLVLVLEGLIYALFTDNIRKMMEMALNMPAQTLRQLGLFMASIGFLLIWLVEKFL